jgi:hypothetical protein
LDREIYQVLIQQLHPLIDSSCQDIFPIFSPFYSKSQPEEVEDEEKEVFDLVENPEVNKARLTVKMRLSGIQALKGI